MDTNPPTQPTPTTSTIPDPVGPDGFTLQTMRDTATRYGAASFIDRQPTDASDVGFLVNSRDSQMQFGLATYTLETASHLLIASLRFDPMKQPNIESLSTPMIRWQRISHTHLPPTTT